MADYEKPLIHGVDGVGNKVAVKVSANGEVVFVGAEEAAAASILTTPVINRATTTGDALILAPGAGLSIVWHSFVISNLTSTEQTFTFRDGGGTAVYPTITLQSKEPFGHDSNKIIRKLAANTGLFIVLSNASAVEIQLTYSVEVA